MTPWPLILANASELADLHIRQLHDSRPVLTDNRRPGDVHLVTGAIRAWSVDGGAYDQFNGSVYVTLAQAIAALAYGWTIDDRFGGVSTPGGVRLVAVTR